MLLPNVFSSPEFIFLSTSGSNGIIVQSVRKANVDLPANPPAFPVLKLSTPFRYFLQRSVTGLIVKHRFRFWVSKIIRKTSIDVHSKKPDRV